MEIRFKMEEKSRRGPWKLTSQIKILFHIPFFEKWIHAILTKKLFDIVRLKHICNTISSQWINFVSFTILLDFSSLLCETSIFHNLQEKHPESTSVTSADQLICLGSMRQYQAGREEGAGWTTGYRSESKILIKKFMR